MSLGDPFTMGIPEMIMSQRFTSLALQELRDADPSVRGLSYSDYAERFGIFTARRPEGRAKTYLYPFVATAAELDSSRAALYVPDPILSIATAPSDRSKTSPGVTVSADTLEKALSAGLPWKLHPTRSRRLLDRIRNAQGGRFGGAVVVGSYDHADQHTVWLAELYDSEPAQVR